ncbi:Alpha,alpha-trehalose-phosphate synthase [UDP-forming] 1 [Linum grandiflorum]
MLGTSDDSSGGSLSVVGEDSTGEDSTGEELSAGEDGEDLAVADGQDGQDLAADEQDGEDLAADGQDGQDLAADEEDGHDLAADEEDGHDWAADEEDGHDLAADEEDVLWPELSPTTVLGHAESSPSSDPPSTDSSGGTSMLSSPEEPLRQRLLIVLLLNNIDGVRALDLISNRLTLTWIAASSPSSDDRADIGNLVFVDLGPENTVGFNRMCRLLWDLFNDPADLNLEQFLASNHLELQQFSDLFNVYMDSSRRFAEKVVENYTDGDIVFCFDIPTMAVPGILRSMQPTMRIGCFTDSQYNARLPVLLQDILSPVLLQNILSANVIGFPNYETSRTLAMGILGEFEFRNPSERVTSLIGGGINEFLDELTQQGEPEEQRPRPVPLPIQDVVDSYRTASDRCIVLIMVGHYDVEILPYSGLCVYKLSEDGQHFGDEVQWIELDMFPLRVIHGNRPPTIRLGSQTLKERVESTLTGIIEDANREKPDPDYLLCVGWFPDIDEDVYDGIKNLFALDSNAIFSCTVGKEHSSADYQLPDQDAVADLLRQLVLADAAGDNLQL